MVYQNVFIETQMLWASYEVTKKYNYKIILFSRWTDIEVLAVKRPTCACLHANKY